MLNRKILLSIEGLLFSLFTVSSFAQFEQGDVYHGFKLLKKEFVKEVVSLNPETAELKKNVD